MVCFFTDHVKQKIISLEFLLMILLKFLKIGLNLDPTPSLWNMHSISLLYFRNVSQITLNPNCQKLSCDQQKWPDAGKWTVLYLEVSLVCTIHLMCTVLQTHDHRQSCEVCEELLQPTCRVLLVHTWLPPSNHWKSKASFSWSVFLL